MLNNTAETEMEFSKGFAAFEVASASPRASYILAANDHKGITEAFGMSATVPAPAANATFELPRLG